MIREAAEAAAAALTAEFGENTRVSLEQLQGDVSPCFYVACDGCTQDRESIRRSRRGLRFCISYAPEQEGGNAGCYDTADRLFQCLEQLIVNGSRYRGTGMSAEFTDKKLIFYVNYECQLQNVQEETALGQMKNGIGAKA